MGELRVLNRLDTAMPTPELETINRQYDPVWKALKPDLVKTYEEARGRFRRSLKHFCDLLQIEAPPRDIVELACGSGIAAVELAKQGYNVIGIDCSPQAIEVAKMLSQHAGAKVRWRQDDMRSFRLDAPVDYVLLWDVVFGIFGSAEEDAKVLQRISEALRPGGRCLFQFYNKDFAIHHGIENCYYYDHHQDIFMLDSANQELSITRIKLYSVEEWQRMLDRVKMKVIIEASSRFPEDPQHGPARVDYLVAEKLED